MDINLIGIGTISGAIIVTSVNIWLHQKNIYYDRAKQQFEKLYNPLNALISKKKKYLGFLKKNENNFEQFAIEYYNFFLDVREIYLNNEVYGSLNIRKTFHSLDHSHNVEFYNYSNLKQLKTKEEIYKAIALFELQNKVDGDDLSEIEQKMEKFIEVVNEDIYTIYHQKPVKWYYNN